MRQTEKAQPESEYEEGVPLLSVRADAEQWVAAIDRAGSAARARVTQVIPPIGAEGLNRRLPAGSCRLFLGPGFRLAAC